MGKSILVSFVDDLTGEEMPSDAVQTIKFGLDGKHYEIDLTPQNAKAFEDGLSKFVSNARIVKNDRKKARK